MEITKELRSIATEVRQALNLFNWQKFTIGIDGFDGSGKTTLAGFLSWQTWLPSITTDMLLKPGSKNCKPENLQIDDLIRLVEQRHNMGNDNEGCPVIIEGVFLLQTLQYIEVKPDYLIYVEKAGNQGNPAWSDEYAAYSTKYQPKDKADYLYKWSESHP